VTGKTQSYTAASAEKEQERLTTMAGTVCGVEEQKSFAEQKLPGFSSYCLVMRSIFFSVSLL